MKNPWLFRTALLLAAGSFVIVVSGSLVTTNATLAEPAQGLHFLSTGHQHGAMGLGAITLAFLVWVSLTQKRVAKLGWTLSAAMVLEGLLGSANLVPGPPHLMGALHATLAHVVSGGLVVFALLLSPLWERPPEHVRDYGWPSMRSLAIFVPLLVLLQVVLGAAFRQQMLSIMPHVMGAMIVSLLILMLAAFVLHQFPEHTSLRPAARTLMVITFVQVFLGIAAFTVRSLPTQETAATLIIAAGHVLTGALTLSAAMVLGVLIRRHVQPKA